MIDIKREMYSLLKEIGPGRMSNTAYDTAWVARLESVDKELSDHALQWICENQLPDGSWGAQSIFYYHDRVICTLAAMIALTYRGKRAFDKIQIERGLQALERITAGATQGLASDPNGATVGFEMIAPTLIAEAEKLGLIKQQGDRILGRLSHLRKAKMAKLAGLKISKHITPAFSSEMAGIDGRSMLDIDNLQEPNGSVANSPSATAYLALFLKPNDNSALKYLHQVVGTDGGTPDFAPIDIFEVAWTLWNVSLIADLEPNIQLSMQPFLDFLEKQWMDGAGIGTASNGTIKDSDDSSLVYEVLARHKRCKDIGTVLQYEEANHFRCFTLESNPSISANIHVLGALRQAHYEPDHPIVQKIYGFLRASATREAYWFDKWHASPYYATSHAIIASSGYADLQVQEAVEWILRMQNKDGSWGAYGNPTLEETAYCIQALCIWQRHNSVPSFREIVKRASQWLVQHFDKHYTPLWIGKALYAPQLVVRSTILSAIQLAEQTL